MSSVRSCVCSKMLFGLTKSHFKVLFFLTFASTVFYFNFTHCNKAWQPEHMLTQPVNLVQWSSKWLIANIYQRGVSSFRIPVARSHGNAVNTGYPRLPLIAKLCDFLVSRRPTSSALPNILPAEVTVMGWLRAAIVFFFRRYCCFVVTTHDALPLFSFAKKQNVAFNTSMVLKLKQMSLWRLQLSVPITWLLYSERKIWSSNIIHVMLYISVGTLFINTREDQP